MTDTAPVKFLETTTWRFGVLRFYRDSPNHPFQTAITSDWRTSIQ
jgi:hypothetical protein